MQARSMKSASLSQVRSFGAKMAISRSMNAKAKWQMLWVHIGSHRYALSYNHEAGTIEVRQDTMRGDVLASFDNSNTAAEVRQFFARALVSDPHLMTFHGARGQVWYCEGCYSQHNALPDGSVVKRSWRSLYVQHTDHK